MAFGIPEYIEHDHTVRHRRKYCAQTVLAIQTLSHPCKRLLDRALARARREMRLEYSQQRVNRMKEPEPGRLLLQRFGRGTHALRGLKKEFINRDLPRIARLGL